MLLLTGCESSSGRKTPSAYFESYWRNLPKWRDSRIDLHKVDLASVKPINIKHEYSFTSHILLYENCPRQYKFYKELQFVEERKGSTLGGSLLHQTIEDIHKGFAGIAKATQCGILPIGIIGTDNKTLCGYVNKKTGYVIVTDKRDKTALRVHRLIMMTFCPIDNPDDYVVDHMNGIRNDNRLENLRWMTQEENLQKRDSNRANIQNNLLKIIQKYGYEETNKILLRVLSEKEN